MIEIEQDVLFSAIKLYGADRQLDKLVEEIGELLQALVKWRQGGDKLHLLEELADVYIMLEQAAMILDVPAETGPTLLQAAIDKKLERLRERNKKAMEEDGKLDEEVPAECGFFDWAKGMDDDTWI